LDRRRNVCRRRITGLEHQIAPKQTIREFKAGIKKAQ
jgi:hypothetical protein